MILWNSILVGFKQIWSYKFRSALTMLGITLGVSSLVALSAITNGMEKGMKENLVASGGLDKARITNQAVPAYQEHLADMAPGKTMRDVYSLQENATLITAISPLVAPGVRFATRGDKRVRAWELQGVTPDVLDMEQHRVEFGRFFTDMDYELASPVCVIGSEIRNQLFGDPDVIGEEIVPVGEQIRIGDRLFTIVGMFEHYETEVARRERLEKRAAKALLEAGKNQNVKHYFSQAPKVVEQSRGWRPGKGGGFAFDRKNQTIYMPLQTALVRFRTANSSEAPDMSLDDISIRVKSFDQLEDALQQARNILMITHNGIEDFTFRTEETMGETIEQSIKNTRRSGYMIAVISLIVGGIGIMNIMLASISERIREIGLRKAMGATDWAVFLQIIIESVVLATLGGLLGLLTSYGLVNVIASLSTGNAPIMTSSAMIFSVVFAFITGLIAGLYPAIKAAGLDPIQALRYE